MVSRDVLTGKVYYHTQRYANKALCQYTLTIEIMNSLTYFFSQF